MPSHYSSCVKPPSFFIFCQIIISDFITKLIHQKPFNLSQIKEKIILRCEDLLVRDVKDNKSMGIFGAEAILKGKVNNTYRIQMQSVFFEHKAKCDI